MNCYNMFLLNRLEPKSSIGVVVTREIEEREVALHKSANGLLSLFYT